MTLLDLPGYAHVTRWLRERHGVQVLGVLEIGSRVRDEAVPNSDHDLRLIVHSTSPMLRFDEHLWTEPPDVPTESVTWQDLNVSEGVTYGLTNLAYIEQSLSEGRYPLNDHTVLHQGKVVQDTYTNTIQQFIIRYMGKRFDNIVADYSAQVEWRVTRKLPAQMSELKDGLGLDASKQAIAPLHTCCRLVRDMAQIGTYQKTGTYLSTWANLERHVYGHWPAFVPTFRTLFAYKRDSEVRRDWFTRVLWGDDAVRDRIAEIVEAVKVLWMQNSG